MRQKIYDVLIIGGSYAGLQAAMTLGRSLRDVLVIDSGRPSNRYAPQAHNLITYDDTEPDKIRRWAREQVLTYPTVQIRQGEVTSVQLQEDGTFNIREKEGNSSVAKKLLLATGLTDILPDIPGFEECWGRSVVHCPYCHGFEVRGKRIGILADAKAAEGFLPLVYNWSKNLIFFFNGGQELSAATEKFIQDRNIELVRTAITHIRHEDGYLNTILTADGTSYEPDALFASLPCEQQTEIAEQLGCKTDEGGFIDTNIVGSTSVPGVYAAGDCTTPMRAISVAIASGYKAGIGINNELLQDEGLKG